MSDKWLNIQHAEVLARNQAQRLQQQRAAQAAADERNAQRAAQQKNN